MRPDACESQLEEILAGYLAADAPTREPVREDLLRRYPALAQDLQAFFVDHDRMCRVAAPVRLLLAGNRRGGGMGIGTIPSAGVRIGAYELLGEIGRGGMGVVFRARHVELGRIVALKMLLTGPWASGDEVRRLRSEAEAVAALDHPNLVPLFEVGEHEGQPFLTMKLIEGKTLACALPEIRREQRYGDLAGLMATIAGAIQHAHERGILHRDLKPANILLDREGRPYLTDFGLARRMGTPGATQTGVAVGTPSYIAPEQAAGPAHAVTTAADVYSLGAILYELLTGRPPFRGDTSLEVMRQLLETDPLHPRVLTPAVPRDLETICLMCLHKDPSRRYGSARELAMDLTAFRAGGPISARPAGKLERANRWCRRNPVVASLGMALGLSFLVGFATTFAQWREARRHLNEIALRRVREEDTFKQAHQAVREFGSLLGEELAHVPGVQELRRKSLERTRAYLMEFIRLQGDVPALRSELADAHLRLASVLGELDAQAAARAAALEALALHESLLQDTPGDPVLRCQLARTHSLLAQLEAQKGESARALEGYRRALALYDGVAVEIPGDTEARAGLARVANNLGGLHQHAGRLEDALQEWRKASEWYDRLAKEHPGQMMFQRGLALSLHNLASLHADTGHHAEATRMMQKSCAIQRILCNEYPQSLELAHGLAVALHHLSMYQGTMGDRTGALRAHQESLDLRERLARENPHVVGYQVALAASCMRGGTLHSDAGRSSEAQACFRRATAILETQARSDPTRFQTRLDLVRGHFSTALDLGKSRNRPQASLAYQKTWEHAVKLVAAFPDLLEGREQLVLTLNNLGLLLGEEGRHHDARRCVRQAVIEARHLVAVSPRTDRFRRQLGGTLAALGKVEQEAGSPAAAFEAIQERLVLWPNDGQELARSAAYLARTAASVGRGQSHLSPEMQKERLRYVDLSLVVLRRALVAGYRDFALLRRASDMAILRTHPGFEETLRQFDHPR